MQPAWTQNLIHYSKVKPICQGSIAIQLWRLQSVSHQQNIKNFVQFNQIFRIQGDHFALSPCKLISWTGWTWINPVTHTGGVGENCRGEFVDVVNMYKVTGTLKGSGNSSGHVYWIWGAIIGWIVSSWGYFSRAGYYRSCPDALPSSHSPLRVSKPPFMLKMSSFDLIVNVCPSVWTLMGIWMHFSRAEKVP